MSATVATAPWSPPATTCTSGLLRVVRGLVVGLSAVVLGAGGHVLVSGMAPSTTPLVAVTVVALGVGIAMSGRTWRLPSLLVVLGGAQVLFHVLLGGGGGHVMSTVPGATMSQPHLAHEWTGLMVAAHVAAAVISALLLQRGEEWCRQLVELLTRPLRSPRLVAVPARMQPRGLNEWTSPIRRRRWWMAREHRRGPPLLGVA